MRVLSLFRAGGRRRPSFTLVLAIGIAGLMPVALAAQDAAPPDAAPPAGTGEEIEVIVTAERLDTPAADVPAQVSVISADEILASGATSIVEVLDRVAGVTFSSYSNEAQAQVDLRGFGNGSVGRVLVLVDGVSVNSPDLAGVNWLAIPLDAVERIEIVRGSAAATYGNHAVAGVINVITRTPQRPLELRAFAGVGSDATNHQRLGVGHSAAWGSLSASAERSHTDGFRDRSAVDTLGLALAAESVIGDDLSLRITGNWADTAYQLPGSLTAAQYESDPTQASNPDDEASEQRVAAGLAAEWTASETVSARLRTEYGYTSVDNDTASYGTYTTRDLTTLSASPALVVEWGVGLLPLRTRLGVDWSHARQEGTGYTDASRNTVSSETALWQDTLGTGITTTAFVTPTLDLRGALRYDQSTVGAEKASAGIDESTTHRATVFEGGATLRPTPATRLYLSGGTLFRYPAIDEQADLNFADQFEADLDPERGFTVEAGGRVEVRDLLSASVGAYWLEMRDEIRYVYDPATFSGANENIGATRRLGADVEARLTPATWIDLSVGYGFVAATFARGDDRGKRVPLTATHTLDAEATLSPVAWLAAGPRVSARSAMYQGGDTANDQERVDPTAVTDLFLRVTPPGIPGNCAVVAEVTNLMDVRYAPVQFYSTFSGTAYYPAPGRRWNLSVSYRF